MIRLRNLIEEQSAGEEAKRRGLKHIGFGRYVDPSNPSIVVAKSVGKKLVAVKGRRPTERPALKEPSIKVGKAARSNVPPERMTSRHGLGQARRKKGTVWHSSKYKGQLFHAKNQVGQVGTFKDKKVAHEFSQGYDPEDWFKERKAKE